MNNRQIPVADYEKLPPQFNPVNFDPAQWVALAKAADQISLRDIIEAVEGPVELNRCLSANDRCKNAETCPLSGVWREAQARMLDVLAGVTLAKVAAGKGR